MADAPSPEYKDFLLPQSDFDDLVDDVYFVLVLPTDNALAEGTSLDTVIEAKAYPDEVYFEEDTFYPHQQVDRAFLYVNYVRMVRVSDVSKGEWQMCYGPNTAREYLEYHKNADLSTPVVVLCLRANNYDLKSLRKLDVQLKARN